jgi:hypothetical protein
MNDLNAALRMLADAGPREAPEHVETALKESFRRHRSARRLRRGIVVAIAAGAAAASLAVVARMPQQPGPPQRIIAHVAPPPIASIDPCGAGTSGLRTRAGRACRAETSGLRIPGLRVRAGRLGAPSRRSPRRPPPADQLATTEFVPLPYGDDTLIGERARIVRVEMPRSALRMAGFNVAQERANERVQADVLLGADGLAHAVRFVRYTE